MRNIITTTLLILLSHYELIADIDSGRFKFNVTYGEDYCGRPLETWLITDSLVFYINYKKNSDSISLVKSFQGDSKQLIERSMDYLMTLDSLNLSGTYDCQYPERSSFGKRVYLDFKFSYNFDIFEEEFSSWTWLKIFQCNISPLHEFVVLLNSHLEHYSDIPPVPESHFLFDCECSHFRYIKKYFE